MVAQVPLQINLLGEFRLLYEAKPVAALHAERPQTLLAYLLLHRHAPQPRHHLAFTLWPDSTDAQARTNLRNLLHTLRQTLPQADAYLAVDAMTLQWRTDAPFMLDVAAFEEAVAMAATAEEDAEIRTCLETAVTLYRGDLLPGNYDDWIIPLREEIRQQFTRALDRLVMLLEQDYKTAVRYGQRLLQLDPLDENAAVQVMRLHALNGDRASVRRVYENCVATLQRELGVEPMSATQQAFAELIRLEPPVARAFAVEALPPAEPPPQTMPQLPRPLPQPTTTFVGREAELADITQLLTETDCRLLTIVGPGGMGKTRLALQTAVNQQRHFQDGVAYVSLAPLRSPDLIPPTIAEALNLRLAGSVDSLTQITNFLSDREMLLVLDNFEHLLDAADLTSHLLAQTKRVKLLVTSRQRLELQEEWSFELGEMLLPDAERPHGLETNSAVALFVQSARRAASDITFAEADYEAIVRICRVVGGLPLGIELAASWMRLLTAEEIAHEMARSLDFLTVTLRNLPPRHRSIRAVFDYSWDLLTPDEQRILPRLSVFRGGFTREAAAQVAGADLTVLSALVNKSLVQRTAAGRYGLHEIIKQYAADHLRIDIDDYWETADKHSLFFLYWLQRLDTSLRAEIQKEALQKIAAESANVSKAWDWAVAQEYHEPLQAASFPLLYFYELRSLFREGERVFGRAADRLCALQENTADPGLALLLACEDMQVNHAYFMYRLGQLEEPEAVLRQSASRLRALGDETVLRFALRYLSLIYGSSGRYEEAKALMGESLALAQKHEQPWEVAVSKAYLGMLAFLVSPLSESEHYFQEALSASRVLGDPRLLAFSMINLGRTVLAKGHPVKARQLIDASLALARETEDYYNNGIALLILGMIMQTTGDLAAAKSLYEKCLDIFETNGDRHNMEYARIYLATLLLCDNEVEAARQQLLMAAHSAYERGNVRNTLTALAGLADVLAQDGDTCTALAWTTRILQHPLLDRETRERASATLAKLEYGETAETLQAIRDQVQRVSFTTFLCDAFEVASGRLRQMT